MLDNANLQTSETKEYERLTMYREEWFKLSKCYDDINTRLFYDVAEAHEFMSCFPNDEKLHVLVTGSLHLVGSFLSLLDPELKQSYENSESD